MERVYETIPDAIIVVIITDPGKRAYSWYQHQKAHGDKIAVENSFYDVISSDSGVTSSLRSECLERGREAVECKRYRIPHQSSSNPSRIPLQSFTIPLQSPSNPPRSPSNPRPIPYQSPSNPPPIPHRSPTNPAKIQSY